MTMNVNKKMAARLTAMALALASCGAMAATANVTMTGEVRDSTCTLAPSSQNVAVDLGTVSTQDFVGQTAGYAASTAGFSLNLENCGDLSALEVWASDADAETGLTNAIRNTHGAGGATGVALQVFKAGATTAMNPNGSRTSDAIVYDITGNANPQLDYTAKMVKVASAQDATAGLVKGTVTLNVAYP